MEVWKCGSVGVWENLLMTFYGGKNKGVIIELNFTKLKTPQLRGFFTGQKRWSFRDWLRKVIQELGINSINN
jgi:hypothetical protein